MRRLAFRNRMIELACEINSEMPAFVARKVADCLNDVRKPTRGSKVLVLGVAYKRDIDDLRESPALEIIRLLQEKGAEVAYHDPFCPEIADDGHTPIEGLPLLSVELTDAVLEGCDAAVVVTDHSSVDYDRVAALAPLVIDTRGVIRHPPEHVYGLSHSPPPRPPLRLVSGA